MATGIVKFFNTTKGFGFITPDGAGPEDKGIFVHVSALGGLTINEGDNVEYDIEETEKGKNAVNVQVINEQKMAA